MEVRMSNGVALAVAGCTGACLMGCLQYMSWQHVVLELTKISDERARFRKQTTKHEVLNELALEMGSSGKIEDIISCILAKARRLIECEASSLFLLDMEHGQLVSLSLSGGHEKVRIPMTSGIAGRVVSTGQALSVEDAYSCSFFNPEVDQKTGYKTRSVLCVPILGQGKKARNSAIACVQLINKIGSPRFTDEDMADLQALALVASVFLWSATLAQFNKWSEEEAHRLVHNIAHNYSSEEAFDEDLFESVKEQEMVRAKPSAEEVEKLRAIHPFDVLQYRMQTEENNRLVPLMIQMWEDLGLIKHFRIDPVKIGNMTIAARKKYRLVPYHNFNHGFDVCHAIYGFLTKGKVREMLEADEMLSLFTAALFHDIDHHGLNNAYHLQSEHPMSILLESTNSSLSSVLEVHHCNVAIQTLSKPECNIFENLDHTLRTKIWRNMISSILATDMKHHGQYCNDAKKLVTDKSDRELLLQILLKAADVSNVTKPFDQCEKWSTLVQREFYLQGDHERALGLPVDPMFDRTKARELRDGQIGFLNFIIPFYRQVVDIFPGLSYLVEGATANKAKFEKERTLSPPSPSL